MGGGQVLADGLDHAVADHHVGDLVGLGRGIDDPPAGQHGVRHVRQVAGRRLRPVVRRVTVPSPLPDARSEPASRVRPGPGPAGRRRGGGRACSSTPAAVGAPSSHHGRPATTVWRAATGPHRSQASIGSVMAPAKAHALERPAHQVADGARPTARPSSPSRPRQPAPPRVAISSASRAPVDAGPVPQPPEQHGVAGLHPQRGRVGRRRSRRSPDPTGTPGGPQLGHRGDAAARRSSCWSSGSGPTPTPGRAQPGDLGRRSG